MVLKKNIKKIKVSQKHIVEENGFTLEAIKYRQNVLEAKRELLLDYIESETMELIMMKKAIKEIRDEILLKLKLE